MANDIPSTATTTQAEPKTIPTAFNHPLDPLTPDEIAAVTLTVRHYITANPNLGIGRGDLTAIRFITAYLLPPPKRQVLAYLGIPLEPGKAPEEKPEEIVRKAEVDFLDILTGNNYNAFLSLNAAESKWTVDTLDKLPEGVQPQISVEELIAAERIVKNDKRVQELAKEVGVEPHQIFCDGWSIGFDDRFPQARRVQQALIFARFSEHDNLYAHPMDFIPVVDANKEVVLHIDFPPHYSSSTSSPGYVLSVQKTGPAPPLPGSGSEPFSNDVDDKYIKEAANRERIPPPKKAFDFLPDLMAETEDSIKKPDGTEEKWKQRDDVKPLHILQPEGVSFKMDGHVLEWQGWKMHVAFSHREGIVLSTITYNDHGNVRPIIYRLSLVEMVVPYGAPEFPHPRKFAFDSGEYGMGTMANELSLGCDCVGQIHYLPGSYVSHSGAATIIKNVICIHEEDNGVLWKHTDFRPGGRSQTTRRRRLVVSMVCTLANYEYIWNYHFYQDGSIEIESRLTGILQVYVAQPDEPNPFGTTVAPRVNAQNHQHLFSFRIDPMIDGINNTVVESDIVPLHEVNPEAVTGSEGNYAGNAFLSKDLPIEKEAGRPYDWERERRWRVVNPARTHYSSGKAVGYAIGLKGGITPMMARKDGWALKRAGFVDYPLWVTKDVESKEGEPEGLGGSKRMWPAGKYVPQTREAPEESIGKWVEKGGKLDVEKGEDILVWLTVGTTHVPRPEDWPVMPVEHINVTIKPQSFFEKNPSMDVPGTRDTHSKSAFGEAKAEGKTCH